MTTLREAAKAALWAFELHVQMTWPTDRSTAAIAALRAALAQEQAEPVAEIIEPQIKVDSHQTLDDAMRLPRAMAQAYENGYKAGRATEREACERACEHQPHWVACVAAIRARGGQT